MHRQCFHAPFYLFHPNISLYLTVFSRFISRATRSIPMLPRLGRSVHAHLGLCSLLELAVHLIHALVLLIPPRSWLSLFWNTYSNIVSHLKGVAFATLIWHWEARIKILRDYGMKDRNSLFLQMERNSPPFCWKHKTFLIKHLTSWPGWRKSVPVQL